MKTTVAITVILAFMVVILAGCAPGTGIQIYTAVPNVKFETVTPTEQINVPGFSIRFNVPGPNPLVNTAGKLGSTPGILIGLWHGIISPITLVVSFINPDVQMYEVHNDGSQYNLGFLLGVAIVFLLLGIIGSSRRR